MLKVLNPEKTVAYCAIVLAEMSLNPNGENSFVSQDYLHFDFIGVSMPPIQVDGELSVEQLAFINSLCDQNRHSSMFLSEKLLGHYRRRISRILNSRELQRRQSAWLHDPVNIGVDVQYSPRVIAENRLRKWTKRASDKSLPGIVGKCYTEYLDSVYARLA